MRVIILRASFTAALLVAATAAMAGSTLEGKVTHVRDGDTIEIGEAVIRLASIDTPESGGQPYAEAATRLVERLVKGKQVVAKVTDRDQYGRLIGWVRLPDGRVLNRVLVRKGVAWVYDRYNNDPSLERLEHRARANNRGLWSQPDPTPPWEWRHQ